MDKAYIDAALTIVENALDEAMAEHAPMNSAHEGKATIEEEFDELWDEIKEKYPDMEKMLKEASHVAAMAVRFMVEVCLDNE